jgi:hypothetical protein
MTPAMGVGYARGATTGGLRRATPQAGTGPSKADLTPPIGVAGTPSGTKPTVPPGMDFLIRTGLKDFSGPRKASLFNAAARVGGSHARTSTEGSERPRPEE